MTPADAPQLEADYFDGRSARAQPVRLHLADGRLHIEGEQFIRAVPVNEVQWPERTRHGARVAHLPDGASVQGRDSAAWDLWMRTSGRPDPLVVRAQQSWRWVLASLLALVLVVAAGFQWGVPGAARLVVAALPHSVDAAVGETAMESLDGHVMRPSRLPPVQQQQIRAAFARAVAALPAGTVPAHRIEFRQSRIGPNAFALPGGTMVMTDELVQRVGGDESILVGVLGHELGHVRERHGLRMLVQVSALGALAGLLVGDFNALLASVPVWLGQASYSRDAERDADAEAVRVLKAGGHSPLAMVRFFETMARPEARGGQPAERREQAPSWLGIAIASHPADAERVRFFREAAAR